MSEEIARKFAQLIASGKLSEARDALTEAGMLRPDGQLSVPHPVLHAGIRAALENQRPPELSFVFGFGDDDSRHKFLFRDRWQPDVQGKEGPWSYLLSNIRPQDPDFRKCEDLVLEHTGVALDVPMNLSDKAGLRPIHAYAKAGDARGVKRLCKHGASPNGYNRTAETELISKKPGWSPMLAALSEGRGAVALVLVQEQIKEELFREENWSHVAAKGVREAQLRGDLDGGLLALRVACCARDALTGLEGRQDWIVDRPLDSEADLHLFMVSQARNVDRSILPKIQEDTSETEEKGAKPSAGSVSNEASKAGGSWFARLAGLAKKKIEKDQEPAASNKVEAEMAPEKEAGLQQKVQDARRDPIIEALARRDAESFADGASSMNSVEEKASMLLSALACAKCAYWAMPLPGGVGDDGRDIDGWACFRALLKTLKPEELSVPIREVGSLSALSVACALGYEDAVVELARAGASLLPDPLREPPSPLTMALRRGKGSLPERLLDAGADPMDGIKPSPLGLPIRAWPVWEAFASRNDVVFGKILEISPQAKDCPGPKGEGLLEAIIEIEESEDAKESDKDFAKLARARLESSYIASAAKETPAEEGSFRQSRRAGAATL